MRPQLLEPMPPMERDKSLAVTPGTPTTPISTPTVTAPPPHRAPPHPTTPLPSTQSRVRAGRVSVPLARSVVSWSFVVRSSLVVVVGGRRGVVRWLFVVSGVVRIVRCSWSEHRARPRTPHR